MTLWEYTELPVSRSQLLAELNNFGGQGWELVKIMANFSSEQPELTASLLFRRQKV